MDSRGAGICGRQIARATLGASDLERHIAFRSIPPRCRAQHYHWATAADTTPSCPAMPSGFLVRVLRSGCLTLALLTASDTANAQVLDKRALFARQSWWDNRDWDWLAARIPVFESPDSAIDATYLYRWELVTKHLTYGSPRSGYTFTEFIDRPFWSGAYGAISCPLGHQFDEVRWLNDPEIIDDFARYWFETPG